MCNFNPYLSHYLGTAVYGPFNASRDNQLLCVALSYSSLMLRQPIAIIRPNKCFVDWCVGPKCPGLATCTLIDVSVEKSPQSPLTLTSSSYNRTATDGLKNVGVARILRPWPPIHWNPEPGRKRPHKFPHVWYGGRDDRPNEHRLLGQKRVGDAILWLRGRQVFGNRGKM